MKETTQEHVIKGLGVSSGIAIGYAHVRESEGGSVPEYNIAASDIGREISRLEDAIGRARKAVKDSQKQASKLSKTLAQEMELLFDVHLRILDEGTSFSQGVQARIRRELINAEWAVAQETRATAQAFAAMKDSYLAARADDMREIGKRLLRCFQKTKQKKKMTFAKNSILITDDMTPADAVSLNPDDVIGVATVHGGPEGHTAIVTRALGITAVLGASELLSHVENGAYIILDGKKGLIFVNPSAETLKRYEKKTKKIEAETKRLASLRDAPARTKDGITISLLANIELPRECDLVLEQGAQGIGLFRSEFLYMNRHDTPNEDEQARYYGDIVKRMKGRPITIRTLDVGGEKLSNSMAKHLDAVENPALGLRAIRFSLKFPAILEDQLAAILRAGCEGPVRILLPMISSIEEIGKARLILNKAANRLKKRGVAIPDKMPPLGIMIEVPGAAMASELFVEECDFFSIGTNDLTMYTLAIDRGDQEVAHLYNPLHPALLRLIRMTGTVGWEHGKPVAVCGEMAGNPLYTALLIGLGIHELSMSPLAVPRIKDCIRHIDSGEARRMASVITEKAGNAGEIRKILDEYHQTIMP